MAGDEFQVDLVSWTVERTVGDRVQLGVVDLAVVVEVFGDGQTALAVPGQQVAVLRADVVEQANAAGIAGLTLQGAGTITPDQLAARHGGPGLAVDAPGQHLMTGILGDDDAVGDKQQGGGAMGADDGLDQIESRLLFAQRDHDVARSLRDKIAAAALQLDALGRLDAGRLPQRVAELGDQRQLRDGRETIGIFVAGRCIDMPAGAELGGHFGGGPATIGRQQSLPGATAALVPGVPQVAQGIGGAFPAVVGLDLDAVQVGLFLQKRQRIRDLVEPHIGTTVLLQIVLLARIGFETDLGLFIAAVAGIAQQVEGRPLQRTVVTAGDRLQGTHTLGQLLALFGRGRIGLVGRCQ